MQSREGSLVALAVVVWCVRSLVPGTALAQEPSGRITGRVVAEQTGESVAGTLVKLRSGATVFTGPDGSFAMDSVVAGPTTLAAVTPGCRVTLASVSVPAGGEASVAFSVPMSGSVRGRPIGGSSLLSLSGDELHRRDYRSVYDAVRALAPYMVSQQSGQVGGARSLSNGSTRTFASNEPLILLDGIRLTNSSVAALDDFEVADLERIEIARGASEAWSYGIGAANGAIILTSIRAAGSALENCEVVFPPEDAS